MSLLTETGRNKNVANFSSVYQTLEEIGSLYNPTNAKVQLNNLDLLQNHHYGAQCKTAYL